MLKNLIEKVKNKNVRAFRKLYNLKKDDGFHICLAFCKNREDATEACQQGFIRIYRSIGNLREIEYFDSWFYRIMMNCAYDVMKEKQSDKLDLTLLAGQSEQKEDFFHTKLLLIALESLPDGYRTVFIMHFFQEMKHRDIAKILHCSPETSRSQYSRAKQKIKEVLSEKMELKFEEI